MNKELQTGKRMNMWKTLPQLAWKGMVKNKTVYYPYLGAGIFSVFTYFVFSSILHNEKHIGMMMFVESAITYGVAVAAGVISGTVLSKLLFLLLLRMTGLPVDVEFTFSFSAVLETAIFFFWVYVINFFADLIQIGRARPFYFGQRGLFETIEKEQRVLL